MSYSDSQSFFEIANVGYLDNSFQGRLLCLKDFLKRCALLPLALLGKSYTTFFRTLSVCFGACLVLVTVGNSPIARAWFVGGTAKLAKDLADWVLLPIALCSCCVRLIIALSFHPIFYFNASS